MSNLLDQLHSDHRRMAGMLAALDREVRRFEAGGHPDYDLIGEIVDYFLDTPERWHHPCEELVLARLALRDPKAAGRVGDLAGAHVALTENLLAFVAGLRQVMNDAEMPRAALVGWADDFIERQRRHLSNEEAGFFPAAERAFGETDWAEVEAEARRIGLAAGEAAHNDRIWPCLATLGRTQD
jgi:hemerythrin-like domain-containing protein